MKIGILTMYYGNISHGGLLQAYALQKALEQMGHNVQVISYDYNYVKRSWIRKLAHEVKLIPYYVLCACYGDHTEKKYEEYMKSISHSKYYIPDSISEIDREYDLVIVGSDQVWNEDYCDEAFFLPFIKEQCRKVAYAASVGRDTLTASQVEHIATKISSFSHVSVREKNLQECISRCANSPIEFVCDPTLLHNKDFWSAHASDRIINTKYILLYSLSPNKKIVDNARDFARRSGFSLVSVPNVNCNMTKFDAKLGDIQAWSIGPKEFLRLIMDAECIITDSFHCTVFSLIFNKDFYCFNRANVGASMNSRLKSLLSYCGIEDRFITIDEISLIRQKQRGIGYLEVNQRIEAFSRKSIDWLLHATQNM